MARVKAHVTGGAVAKPAHEMAAVRVRAGQRVETDLELAFWKAHGCVGVPTLA